MKLLQINSVVNIGSTGRIAEQIGLTAQRAGWDSYIAYGRNASSSQSSLIKIGNKADILWHGVMSRFLDAHGRGSRCATSKFVDVIREINPDIVHLHNIHGYYLNYKVLFEYLAQSDIPVVWTLHDCWPLTGHCSHFEFAHCDLWKTRCSNCVNKLDYPCTIGIDRSAANHQLKMQLFNSVRNLTFVPVSQWLANLVSQSRLHNYRMQVINNGIDLSQFKLYDPQEIHQLRNAYGLQNATLLLGVTSSWGQRKGLDDFIALSRCVPANWKIILVGLTQKQLSLLPPNIIGIQRTENIRQLAMLYSMASVFVNLTYEDTYPTTNLEAIACGTPVVTYRTGGSPESISPDTGFVVDQGDLTGVVDAVKNVLEQDREMYRKTCRTYAEMNFNMEDKFQEYIDLYNVILNK